MNNFTLYDPTHLPSTQRHYPVTNVPDRPDIQGIQAGGLENGTLKPGGSHRSSKRSSVTTQVTTVSSGGYPGIQTGLGTPMPWMNVHARKILDRNYGPPPGNLYNVKEEEDDLEADRTEKKENKWKFTLIIALWLFILAIIIIGAIIAVVLINKDDSEEEQGAVGTNKRMYFLARYEASMSLNNEEFSDELDNEDSPRFLQLGRESCGKVNSIYASTEDYAGCDAVRFKEQNNLVYIDITVKMLYVIDATLGPGVEGTDEEVLIINAALTDLRRSRADEIANTFIRGVNDILDLGNAHIDSVPRTAIVNEETDFCVPHQCSGGTCNKIMTSGINTGYSCTCPEGRTGIQCQVVL